MRFILLTVLIDMVAIGLVIPVLPVLVGQFSTDKADQAYWYAAVMGTFGVASFISGPILGALSDKYGRRPVLLLGFCGFAFSFFGTALATQMWMLLAVRVVSGSLQANVAVANAYVIDISTPEERPKRFGQIGSMFGLGFIIGPVMGGFLGTIDLRLPFFVAGGLALLNLVYGYFVMPESLPADRRQAFTWRSANPVASFKGLMSLKNVGYLVAVIWFVNVAQFVLRTSWALYTDFRFGWTPEQNGWSLLAIGVMTVLVQGVFLQPMVKWLGIGKLAFYGLVTGTVTYLLWGLAYEGWMMYAIIPLNIFAFTVQFTVQAIVSNAMDPSSRGRSMGTLASLASLAAVVAPLIGAPLMGMVSHLPHDDWRMGAPFYLCAALMGLSTVLAVASYKRMVRQGLVPSTAASN